MGIKELKVDIADLLSDLEQIELPYGVTQKLNALMETHDIKKRECGHGVSAG